MSTSRDLEYLVKGPDLQKNWEEQFFLSLSWVYPKL